MGNYSFGLTTSKDWFVKLKNNYSDYLQNPISSDKAVDFCTTAYHMNEWVKSELTSSQKQDLALKRNRLKRDFEILLHLANGSKHKGLRYPTLITNTKLQGGAFDQSFSRAFDISRLEIHLDGEEIIYFQDLAERIFQFWNNYFQTK